MILKKSGKFKKPWEIIKRRCISFNFTSTIEADVCIVGGGSIGMTLSALLHKYKLSHVILEKEKNLKELFNHPKAHYISPRTVEILKYAVDKENIFQNEEKRNIEKVENWRHYRYCEFLLDKNSYYGEIDHLKGGENKKIQGDKYLNYIKDLSGSFPMNLGQNKLNNILFENIRKSGLEGNYYSGYELDNFEFLEDERKYLIKSKNEKSTVIKSKIIVGCDGSHSQVRKLLNYQNVGKKNIQNFVNAHFFSKDLADRLKRLDKSSMLHFIFNPYYVCVLISYDMELGEFVLQIPYFKKVERKEDYDKEYCLNILRQLISQNNKFSESIDIKIEGIGFWSMKNVVVDKWYKNGIFLIGDASHQYPPSGGYGLNMGVSDAYALAHRIKSIVTSKDQQEEHEIKKSFEQERILHSTFVSQCANENYSKFLKCCETLGLNVEHCNTLQNVVSTVIPNTLQKTVFGKLMNTGIYFNYLL